MGFTEELAAERRPEGQPNKFRRFIESQPDADDIRKAMADPNVSTGQIYRALKKRGFTGHESTVMRHCKEARDVR